MSVSRIDDAVWKKFGGEFYRAFRECAEAGLQIVETAPSMRMKVGQYGGGIELGTSCERIAAAYAQGRLFA